MPDDTAGVLFETVEDTIGALESTLVELQAVTQERDSLREENKKLASQVDEKQVYLKKVASAPQLDPVQVASVVKKVEKAGFIKAGSAAEAAQDLQKNPAQVLFLLNAMASAFVEDDFSEGALVKSGSFGETAPSQKGQEGKDYFVDKDGWSRLLELAQKQGN